MLADYGSTKVTLREHPIELMRADLGEDVLSSTGLERARDGRGSPWPASSWPASARRPRAE